MEGTRYRLQMVRQPPSKTVYMRILKPFPRVKLYGRSQKAIVPPKYLPGQQGGSTDDQNLFLHAELVNWRTGEALQTLLDGSKEVRLIPEEERNTDGSMVTVHHATFQKLKILTSSHHAGCIFALKFKLHRATNDDWDPWEDLNCEVSSNMIEVFFYTGPCLSYRTEISEIIPSCSPKVIID